MSFHFFLGLPNFFELFFVVFTYFIKCTHKFFLFDAIVNEIVFLISFSDFLLLLYKDAINVRSFTDLVSYNLTLFL